MKTTPDTGPLDRCVASSALVLLLLSGGCGDPESLGPSGPAEPIVAPGGRNVLAAAVAPTNVWGSKAPLPTARSGHAVGVVNNMLYAVGGKNSAGIGIATNHAYTLATNSWRPRRRCQRPDGT